MKRFNNSRIKTMSSLSHSTGHHYSPFSIKTVSEDQNRALLLQFILTELLNAKDVSEKNDPLEFVFSSPACFFPNDWSYEIGCLNKIYEHSTLLEYAFPEFPEQITAFKVYLDNILSSIMQHKKNKTEIDNATLFTYFKELYAYLDPLLISCRDNEGLLLFLLKNQKDISEIAFPDNLNGLLNKMFPEGLKKLSETLRTKYQNRGFTSLLSEIDELLLPYES